MPPARLLIIPAAAALCLLGCGDAPKPSGAVPASVTSAAEPQAATAASSTPRAVRPEPEPIATRRGSVKGESVKVELTLLHRRGATVSLELRMSTKFDGNLLLDDVLDDGLDQKVEDPDPESDGVEGYSMDGISLIDGTNGTRYAPARDQRGYCVCDHPGNLVLGPGAQVVGLSATFGAPPPEVKVVDVVIPGFGTVPDVPLD